LTSVEFLERKGRSSQATEYTYGKALRKFADCFDRQSADAVADQIKAHKLDAYKVLDKFVSYLIGQGLAPKTVITYVTAASGFLRYEEIDVDPYRFKTRVELPRKIEISIDRIPTRNEMKTILLASPSRTRALIALLATSGLRIGEAANLRIANIDFKMGKLTLLSKNSKSRRNRISFLSQEALTFMEEYLGPRLKREPEGWLLPDYYNPKNHSSGDGLYMEIYRVLKKCKLLGKLDPDSKRNQLHPHCFRKYFFSKLIGSGVDRGIAELFMGHDFALDIAYLHLTDEQLREHWRKAEPEFEFLIDKRQIHEVEAEVRELTERNQQLEQKLATIESRTHILDDADLEKRLMNSKFFKEMVTTAMQDALAGKD
jgi:integrase